MKYGLAPVLGTSMNVSLSGEGAISSLTITDAPDLARQCDPAFDHLAHKAATWISEGVPFTYPVQLSGTPFQRAVYALVATIPEGTVTTYRDVASRLGTRGYRAVGQALNKNPLLLLIPCHRVISSDGTLGGFAHGTEMKARILRGEGVGIEDGRVAPSCIRPLP